MAALEAHDTLGMIGQPIDDLALAFISPLRSDYNYILVHVQLLVLVLIRQFRRGDNLPDIPLFY